MDDGEFAGSLLAAGEMELSLLPARFPTSRVFQAVVLPALFRLEVFFCVLYQSSECEEDPKRYICTMTVINLYNVFSKIRSVQMARSLNNGCALPLTLLLALALVLSACGTNLNGPGGLSQTPGGTQPDRVQIQVETMGFNQGSNPVLALVQTSLVRRLYRVVLALPEMLQDRPCTDEAGPSYWLTFLHGGQRLVELTAQRFSCQRVTIAGSSRERQTTPDFWSLVDQAIFAATPVGTPEWLALLYRPQVDHPPLTARISSIEATRRLYNAILGLPLAPSRGTCSQSSSPEYSLLFHQADLTIPSLIADQCGTIDLEGSYRTRSGTFLMTAAFKQLLKQTLAGATFAPARPDQLTLTLQPGNGTASHQVVTDTDLLRRIYTRAFMLPPAPLSLPQTCDEQDKVNGRGRWYTFGFSQWGLALLRIELFEGSCRLITLYPSGTLVWGDASFWSFVHQAARD